MCFGDQEIIIYYRYKYTFHKMRFAVLLLSTSLWVTIASEYTITCQPSVKKSSQMQCNPSHEFITALKGSKGDRGEVGIRGPRGTRGPYGNFGPLGPKGSKGDKGDAGATGERGTTGLPGPKGNSGSVGFDVSEFQEWRLRMEKEMEALRRTVEVLGSCCTRGPYLPPHLSNRDPDDCMLVYKNRCYNLTDSGEGNPRTWQQYVEACESSGGAAANIYDPIHYNLTVNAIRATRLPRSTHLMLGMRYDVFLRQLLFHNGTEANFIVPWRPETPTRHPTHTTIQLYVKSNPHVGGQGFYNRAGNHVRQFGLCEYAVDISDNEGSGSE